MFTATICLMNLTKKSSEIPQLQNIDHWRLNVQEGTFLTPEISIFDLSSFLKTFSVWKGTTLQF